jgi:uncharacterized protein (DUF433 family)
MALETPDLLTPAEAAAVADVPIRTVYKIVAERLPKKLSVRRRGQKYLVPEALICIRLDYKLPKEVPVKVRRFVYGKLKTSSAARVRYGTDLFSYVVDPGPASQTVTSRLQRYREARKMIVEDPEIQGGVPTFKGTRIPVHQIAALLLQGVPDKELREDYPNLTPAMIEAALIYVQAHPRRGRPRKPTWRRAKPSTRELFKRRGV